MQVRPLRAWVLALPLLLTACGTPPHKEMDQAQGAIDAARAAGADRYAHEEFTAATDALASSTAAVEQRDYRLALNHALESRERAQNAARMAAEAQGKLRAELERSTTEVNALLAQANGRLQTAEKTRVPRRIVTNASQLIAATMEQLQKADAAVQAQEFTAAQAALATAKERVSRAITLLDDAMAPPPARRRK
jgi:hypothetical protein